MGAPAGCRRPKPVDEPAQHPLLTPIEEVELYLLKLLQESFVAGLRYQSSQQPAGPPVSVMQQQIDENALRAAT